MSISYTYKSSNGTINKDKIVNKDTSGILESYGDKGFRYTPTNKISKKVSNVLGNYTIKSPDEINNRPNLTTFVQDTISDDNKSLIDQTTYYFGIDNISASNTIYDNVSGYISKPINIQDSSYIELLV